MLQILQVQLITAGWQNGLKKGQPEGHQPVTGKTQAMSYLFHF
jgi:hypothetical protein